MQQLALATATGVETVRTTTRREVFLAARDQGVPWAARGAVMEPGYPKPAGAGRRPAGVERRRRSDCLQQWCTVSDPAVAEARYDAPARRAFVGLALGREPVPDETHGLAGAPPAGTASARPDAR